MKDNQLLDGKFDLMIMDIEGKITKNQENAYLLVICNITTPGPFIQTQIRQMYHLWRHNALNVDQKNATPEQVKAVNFKNDQYLKFCELLNAIGLYARDITLDLEHHFPDDFISNEDRGKILYKTFPVTIKSSLSETKDTKGNPYINHKFFFAKKTTSGNIQKAPTSNKAQPSSSNTALDDDIPF